MSAQISEDAKPSNSKLLNDQQIGEALGLKASAIRRLRYQRKIPFIRLGHRSVAMDLQKVRAALDKLEVKELWRN
jgi:hypothetical protein